MSETVSLSSQKLSLGAQQTDLPKLTRPIMQMPDTQKGREVAMNLVLIQWLYLFLLTLHAQIILAA